MSTMTSPCGRRWKKWENNRYASIPVLNRKGEYVGTLTEGDILWGLKKFHGLDLEAAEDIPIREFEHKRDYKGRHGHHEHGPAHRGGHEPELRPRRG